MEPKIVDSEKELLLQEELLKLQEFKTLVGPVLTVAVQANSSQW